MPKANGYIKSLTKLDTGHKRQFELIAVMRGVPMYVIIKEAMADFVEKYERENGHIGHIKTKG